MIDSLYQPIRSAVDYDVKIAYSIIPGRDSLRHNTCHFTIYDLEGTYCDVKILSYGNNLVYVVTNYTQSANT